MSINLKYLTWIAIFGSFALLVAAYGFEFLGGMSPCKMCLWQRWPHIAVIPIGILAIYSNSTVLLKVSGLIILLGAMIAFYHMGVEYKWWDGPSTCTSGTISGLTSSELLAKILKAPIVRCDEVQWQFIGLSMAAWNGLISIILSIVWFKATLK